jgi:hypothetical protein
MAGSGFDSVKMCGGLHRRGGSVSSRLVFVWNNERSRDGRWPAIVSGRDRFTLLYGCFTAPQDCHFLPFIKSAAGWNTGSTQSGNPISVMGSVPMFVILGDQKGEWQCHARLPFTIVDVFTMSSGCHFRGFRRLVLSVVRFWITPRST